MPLKPVPLRSTIVVVGSPASDVSDREVLGRLQAENLRQSISVPQKWKEDESVLAAREGQVCPTLSRAASCFVSQGWLMLPIREGSRAGRIDLQAISVVGCGDGLCTSRQGYCEPDPKDLARALV